VFDHYDIVSEADLADAAARVSAYAATTRADAPRVTPLRPAGSEHGQYTENPAATSVVRSA
jgi:hypothetical protein